MTESRLGVRAFRRYFVGDPPSALDGRLAEVDPVVRVLDGPALLAVAVAKLREGVLEAAKPDKKRNATIPIKYQF